MRAISNYLTGSCALSATRNFFAAHRNVLTLACNVDRIWMAVLAARDISNFAQKGFGGLGIGNLTAGSFAAGVATTIVTIGISQTARNFRASLPCQR